MCSREEPMKAIELYIKYDTGMLWEGCSRYSKYSLEEKTTAVEHYLEHGCNLSRTVRALGYPSRDTLRAWGAMNWR